MTRLMALAIVLASCTSASARAQIPQDVWKSVADKIDLGSTIRVELQDGRDFDAILVGVRDDAVLVQPKVRVAVPVQEIPYAAIASIERRTSGGMGAAKAAAIGVATGVGAFFGMLLILLSNVD